MPRISHIFLLLFFKVILIIFTPLTGDEAYFIVWSKHLALGYYDHPPMIGWIIFILSYISDSYIFFRLFGFAVVLIIGYLMYRIIISYQNPDIAKNITVIFLISNVSLLTFPITNDIALLLFTFLGFFFFIRYLNTQKMLFILLSGLFFGNAILSKYLALLVIFGVICFILAHKKFIPLKNVAIFCLSIALPVTINIYYNYNNCWNNILFNFFSRTKNLSFNFIYIIETIAMMIYLLNPWNFVYIFKSKLNFSLPLNKIIIFAIAPTLFIFIMLSTTRIIALHWFLSIIPMAFLLLSNLNESHLKKAYTYTLLFTYIHVLVCFAGLYLVHLAPDVIKNQKYYRDVIYGTYPGKIVDKMNSYRDINIFTTGYTSASILSYHLKRDIGVIFNRSKYGRDFDKYDNFNEYNGKSFVIFDKKNKLATIAPYCTKVNSETLDIKGATFYFFKCDGFNSNKYKLDYIDKVKEKYYTPPDWFPKGNCYYDEMYYKPRPQKGAESFE